ILVRSRGNTASLALVALIAWLPPVLMAMRTGHLGLTDFAQTTPLAVALGGIVLPLIGLLAGTDLLANELEVGSLSQVLTLPIARRALLLGKWLGGGGSFVLVYVAAFASTTIAIASIHGRTAALDYVATAVAGLLLLASCFGIGTVFGALRTSRTRALALALTSWVVFVFVLDAIILALVVALAPPPPQEVGRGGHTEIAPAQGAHAAGHHDHAQHGNAQHDHAQHDPHAKGSSGDAVQIEAKRVPWPAWLMLFDPVDLFRLSILAVSPSGGTQFLLGLPRGMFGTWVPITLGWVIWLSLPYWLAVWRFGKLGLRSSA
ncbi:MAG: ABC transporter permease subunit, partial [Myxococcota bacterium]